MNKVRELPVDKLNKFISKQVGGFTSLREKQKQIKKQKITTPTSAKILRLKIPDPNFASILNEHGVVQVGEVVYKVTNKYTYIFKNRAAFESYNFSNTAAKASKPFQAYIQPCIQQNRVNKLQEDVYRATNCGGGYGGGGGGSDDPPEVPVDELDHYANLGVDYPAERSKYW